MPKSPFKKKTMNNKTPEETQTVEIEQAMKAMDINYTNRSLLKMHIRQALKTAEARGYEKALRSKYVMNKVKEAHTEGVRECIKLSDDIESKEPDGGTKQWMAFKAFRNTMRDRLTPTDVTDKT